ncbi:hypothetical protein K3495_g12020 [Podosphaera aphanis]|nr:hypothetical protein K3495_g12020 [Podosphaera aphanis]
MAAENQKPPAKLLAKSTADPILRNALRYTISAKEYETLHKYVLSRSRAVRRRVPSVIVFERLVSGKRVDERHISCNDGSRHGEGLTARDDHLVAAIRESLRVFFGTAAGLKLWGTFKQRLLGKKPGRAMKTGSWNSSDIRLSLSLSTILLLHRILFRFFTQLRSHLLAPSATPFRKRNKRTSATLTSRYTPALGASLAGLALSIFPARQLRVIIAIYAFCRATEFAYNLAEVEGWIWKNGRPAWWGSWILFPFASGQLLLAFVFDRDCFPQAYGEFILKYSQQYIHNRPDNYPSYLPWPSKNMVVDNLAAMAKLSYPVYISPTLFPSSAPLLPSIAPINSSAHPLITRLSCATLHPSDPSCLRTYLKYWITVFPQLTRFFAIVFSVLHLPGLFIRPNAPSSPLNAPISVLQRLLSRVIRYSIFVSGSIGTSWASICFFQYILPHKILSKNRFFLGGFLGGLWAWVVRRQARSEFLYSMRASILSCWQVGKKRGWWRGFQGGDIFVFVASLALLNVIFERNGDRGVVDSAMARIMLRGARGEGWRGRLSDYQDGMT